MNKRPLHNNLDAHHHSNRHEANKLRNVIIDLTGKVSEKTVAQIIECLKMGHPFILHNDESLFYYSPAVNWGQSKTITNTGVERIDFKFESDNDLLNSVKFTLLTMHNLIVPNVKELRKRGKVIIYGETKSIGYKQGRKMIQL